MLHRTSLFSLTRVFREVIGTSVKALKKMSSLELEAIYTCVFSFELGGCSLIVSYALQLRRQKRKEKQSLHLY